MVHLPLSKNPALLDRAVESLLKYIGAMLRALRIGARMVDVITGLDDEHVRKHRKKSGLSASASAAGIRDEQL